MPSLKNIEQVKHDNVWTNTDQYNNCKAKCAEGEEKCLEFQSSYCVKREFNFFQCKKCQHHNSTNPSCGTKEKPYRCVETGKGYRCACEEKEGVLMYTDKNCIQHTSPLLILLYILIGFVILIGLALPFVDNRSSNYL